MTKEEVMARYQLEENIDYLIRAHLNCMANLYNVLGVRCDICGGTGRRIYGSTATWMGGIGGAAITEDVCDKCWGSGRTDKTGPDLRKIYSEIRRLKAKAGEK